MIRPPGAVPSAARPGKEGRSMRRFAALAVLAFVPAAAHAAADFGTVTVAGKRTPLTSACAYAPRFDTQGWGKPEVVLLLSNVTIDCAAATGWVSPDNGAFEQVVRKGRGALVSVSFKPGLQLGRVSVSGVGYSLGNDNCEGCAAQAAYAGAGFKGTLKTGKPLVIAGDTPVALDVRFDLAKPGPPAAGEKLAGGGDPGKAYLAYLKAYQAGDYDTLVKMLPEGKAEDSWGYYQPAERKTAIQGEKKPASAKILDAWKTGKNATLVVEVPHPFNPALKTKAAIGLWFDGTGWRVLEEQMDFGGTMFGR
jgi:hypothetical protein